MARRFPKYSAPAMFSCLYNYFIWLYLSKPCFARMKNFLTSFSQHVGSGGGGCVFASRSFRLLPEGLFSLLSGINHKKKGGKGAHTFCCIWGGRPKGWARSGGFSTAARRTYRIRPCRAWQACRCCGHTTIKKGDRHMTVALMFRGGKAYWPRSTSTGFSSRSSRNLSGRSFWSGTVMSPWTYSR